MFHWHMLQNGVMLVGKDSGSLIGDLKQLPKLVLSFFTVSSFRDKSVDAMDIVEERELQLIGTES